MPDETPKRGRGRPSTAAVTYDTLLGIAQGLERANSALERLDEKLDDTTTQSSRQLNDHEARIRILEASLTTAIASSQAKGNAFDQYWGVLTAVVAIGFTALNFFLK